MPRRNKRDRRYDPKELNINQTDYYNTSSDSPKPVRRRKGKWDKKIYRNEEVS